MHAHTQACVFKRRVISADCVLFFLKFHLILLNPHLIAMKVKEDQSLFLVLAVTEI